MEIVVRNPLIAHHILPQILYDNPLIQKAAAGYTKVVNGVTEHFAFHMNNFTNGMPLSALQHNDGGHSIYITKIKTSLDGVFNSNPNMSIEDANNALTAMINVIKTRILENPNLTLNQIAPLL